MNREAEQFFFHSPDAGFCTGARKPGDNNLFLGPDLIREAAARKAFVPFKDTAFLLKLMEYYLCLQELPIQSLSESSMAQSFLGNQSKQQK